MIKSLLRRDDRGIGAVEFALVAPVLISFIIGISQLGKVFFASADMKNALAAGARVASNYPVPLDETILAAVNDRLVRSEAGTQAVASIVHGTDNGNPFVEIKMTYTVPLEFIFFETSPVAMKDSRKVYTQVTSANTTTYVTPPPASSGVTSSGVTSSGVTSSGVTSSGVTSSGVTSSGNGSNGNGSNGNGSNGNGSSGNTTTTSTSSGQIASSTTTTSSGSSGSTGSSGSSGNGSSGHEHGNCNKKC